MADDPFSGIQDGSTYEYVSGDKYVVTGFGGDSTDWEKGGQSEPKVFFQKLADGSKWSRSPDSFRKHFTLSKG